MSLAASVLNLRCDNCEGMDNHTVMAVQSLLESQNTGMQESLHGNICHSYIKQLLMLTSRQIVLPTKNLCIILHFEHTIGKIQMCINRHSLRTLVQICETSYKLCCVWQVILYASGICQKHIVFKHLFDLGYCAQ